MSSTQNKIRYGLCNVYYAKLIDDNTYDTPISLPGAISISLKKSGNDQPIYADNVLFYDLRSNNGYTGDLEMSVIPDSFKIDILGEEIDDNGVQSENTENQGSLFALLFEFSGDQLHKRHVFYRVHADRPDIASSTTNEKTKVESEKLSISCYASAGSGFLKDRVKASVDNSTEHVAIYNAWFDKVYDGTVSTLGSLTVTSIAGSTTGDTFLTVTPTLTSGNSYMYKTAASVTLPAYNDVCNTTAGYTTWNGTSDITATTGNEIAVIEVDSSYKAIKAGKTTVTSK